MFDFHGFIEQAKGTGHFMVLKDEFYTEKIYGEYKDTLWDGELKNGKMVGLWKILDLRDNVYYFVDFDHRLC